MTSAVTVSQTSRRSGGCHSFQHAIGTLCRVVAYHRPQLVEDFRGRDGVAGALKLVEGAGLAVFDAVG